MKDEFIYKKERFDIGESEYAIRYRPGEAYAKIKGEEEFKTDLLKNNTAYEITLDGTEDLQERVRRILTQERQCSPVEPPLPLYSPATTTRSNRGFELSPRHRSSKIVIRKPPRRCTPYTATEIANRCRAYPTAPDADAAASLSAAFLDHGKITA